MKDYITRESDPMLDPIIKSYYESNMNLARTIGIKSSRSADQQNITLMDLYGDDAVDFDEPTTWKYYMNLAGLYHPTDTQMTITSLDTLDPITFNKTNLISHPNTKIEYAFGTRYYQTLVNQYPQQEDLIMGILMPCDIDDSINAEDGDILRWDASLVEPQEYSLIKELETGIKQHIARWYVDAYSKTDSYYLMYYYSQLYLFIITKLFNLRDERRHTYEVHSFHVKMFLKGYMNLDQYYTFMTREQALYLYRNLPRLIRYIGYNVQFEELIENILTKRDIQLFNYTLRQTNTIDTDLYPTTVVRSEPLNHAQSNPRIETISPEELFLKEETVVYGTEDFYDVEKENVIFKIRTQDQAKLVTKDVITQTEDTVSIYPLSFQDFLFRHWGYMAGVGLYISDVTFQNPRTGNYQTVSAKVAFSYFYYLSLSYTANGLVDDLSKSMLDSDLDKIVDFDQIRVKVPITIIPNFLGEHHVAATEPSVTDVLKVVDNSLKTTLTPAAQALLDQFVPITTTNSTELFYELCVRIYKGYLAQNTIADTFHDIIQKGYVKNMVYRLYQDTMVQLSPSATTVSEFLAENNLDSFEIVGNSLAVLLTNIYEASTGTSSNTASNHKYVTEAMISIMRTLSSYNIQYIDIISETDLTLIRTEPNVINGYISTGSGTSDDYVSATVIPLPIGVYVQDVISVRL